VGELPRPRAGGDVRQGRGLRQRMPLKTGRSDDCRCGESSRIAAQTGESEGAIVERGLDLIGDVHGHATALVSLLERLGYRIDDDAWRHTSRTAIFVGDLIDRGPEQLRTVKTVRRMVETGAARCLMGNHEYNAIAWMTPHPHHPNDFLRAHNHRHHSQHKAFLAEAEGDVSQHRELIEWFAQLPIWLELDGCRVVHACWDERQMERRRPHVDADGRLKRSTLEHSMLKGSHEHLAIEVLLKGP
jgi:hypothetical protein